MLRGVRFVMGIVGVLLVAAVIAVVVFGVMMASSIDRAQGLVSDAQASYESAQKYALRGDLGAALKSTHKAIDSVSELNDELSSPLWDFAVKLPVIGEDAAMAREMASIATDLANEAVRPVVNELDAFVSGSALAEGPLAAADHAAALGAAFSNAPNVVYACEQRANALPHSHFDKLNDGAAKMRDSISTVADVLHALEDAANALGYGVTELIDQITG